MLAAEHARPQPDPLAPGERVQPQVARHHRHVEVVPPLRLDVHVTAEYLDRGALAYIALFPIYNKLNETDNEFCFSFINS